MDARRLDWSDLEMFLATARGGSLAAAAGALGLDASTVHRRVGKLESELHTRLFDRSQRGYSLTSAGEELLAHAEAMDEQVVAARRKVVARDDALSGVVRVATVDGLAIGVLAPIFASFREAHPSVTVAVDLNSSLTDLAREPADVAIRLLQKAPDGDVIAKPICKVRLAMYASPAYLKKHGTPRRLEDLQSHATVRGNAVLGAAPFEHFMDRHSDPAKVAFRAMSFVARQAAIRAGLGVGLLGCFMGDCDKALRRLALPDPDISVSLTMLIHVDVHRNARVRAFVKHTHAALLAQRALFEGRP